MRGNSTERSRVIENVTKKKWFTTYCIFYLYGIFYIRVVMYSHMKGAHCTLTMHCVSIRLPSALSMLAVLQLEGIGMLN